jgi:hypothetical protein
VLADDDDRVPEGRSAGFAPFVPRSTDVPATGHRDVGPMIEMAQQQ